jgi:hypothetical protein
MFIRHLIHSRNGKKLVEFKEVLCEPCKRCCKEIPRVFVGVDKKSTCAIEDVYRYSVNDIIEEHSSVSKSTLPKKCGNKGCSAFRYN